jgi:hypothetical protein
VLEDILIFLEAKSITPGGNLNPYKESIIDDKIFRSFEDESADEFEWHRDKEKRLVTILESDGWMIQFDNCIPVEIYEGQQIIIMPNEWHRIIKGKGKLSIQIELL